jgi:hypothetical protein
MVIADWAHHAGPRRPLVAGCDPWTAEPRGSVSYRDITALRERDNGRHVRLSLTDGRELRLQFSGPNVEALRALRQELLSRDVPRELFGRDPAERGRTRRGSMGELKPTSPLRS